MQSTGYVLMGIAGAIALRLLFVNFRWANLVYGVAGSALHLVVLVQFGYAALAAALVSAPLVLGLMWLAGPIITPVYVNPSEEALILMLGFLPN
jgi:hypothetical protein